MTRPGDHVPATPRQSQIMRTDIELSTVMDKAITNKDMDLLADAMAEKLDLERALEQSRTESWHNWHIDNTGGAA